MPYPQLIDVPDPFADTELESHNRKLLSISRLDTSYAIPSFIRTNVADVRGPIQSREKETPFFWHIPKSGGTAIQHLYWCMGLTLANEVGANPKFQKDKLKRVVQFQPWEGLPNKVVNVDTTTHKGILRAQSMKLLGDGFTKPKVDLILSGEFQFVSMMLYSPQHKARVFALFRHPIHRSVSMFFYLQKAHWEPTYNPAYQSMTLYEWSQQERIENNFMTRKLVAKTQMADLGERDLELAKEIVRSKFLVGLMEEFEESVHRFNAFLDIDEDDPTNQECFQKYAAKEEVDTKEENKMVNRQFASEKRIEARNEQRKLEHELENNNNQRNTNERNSNKHPEVDQKNPAWAELSRINHYDMKLYQFVKELFEEQRSLFKTKSEIEKEFMKANIDSSRSLSVKSGTGQAYPQDQNLQTKKTVEESGNIRSVENRVVNKVLPVSPVNVGTANNDGKDFFATDNYFS